MPNSLVSIIIPAYNAAMTVEQSIRSVLEQTYSNLEIIVIDDGSTDSTFLKCSALKDDRLSCFRIENSGASAARNVGLQKANGDFIQFLDADDILQPPKIEQQVLLLEHNNGDIAYCDWTYMNDEVVEKEMVFINKPFTTIESGRDLLLSMGKDTWYVPVFCWLTRRSVIDKAGLWNETLTNNDDGEFFARVLYNSQRVYRYPKILGHYRRNNQDSLSKSNTSEKVFSALRSFDLIIDYFQDKADTSLMVYPKRLFEIQFLLIRHRFPALAKVAARGFDGIKEELNLAPKSLKKCVAIFGLYRGHQCFELLQYIRSSIKTSNRYSFKKVKKMCMGFAVLFVIYAF